jgi:hypothetical protein
MSCQFPFNLKLRANRTVGSCAPRLSDADHLGIIQGAKSQEGLDLYFRRFFRIAQRTYMPELTFILLFEPIFNSCQKSPETFYLWSDTNAKRKVGPTRCHFSFRDPHQNGAAQIWIGSQTNKLHAVGEIIGRRGNCPRVKGSCCLVWLSSI